MGGKPTFFLQNQNHIQHELPDVSDTKPKSE